MVSKRQCSQKNRKRQKNNLRRSSKGGKIIGVGTYGCVFSPPLPCYKESRPPSDYVSKLMAKDDAVSELSETKKINTALSKISNHSYYFAGEGIKMCKLGDITEDDIRGKQCFLRDFSAKEILKTVKNGNIPPHNIRLIQQPNLGSEFFDYLLSETKNSKRLSGLIRGMNNLLENGILVMNSKGIYHQDLKSANLLVSKQVPRIIDWGLAIVTYNGLPVTNADTRGEKMTEVGSIPMRAFVMFNSPISAPLFYETARDGDNSGIYTNDLEQLLANKISKQTFFNNFFETQKSSEHFTHLWINMVKASIKVLKFNNVPGYDKLPESSTIVIENYLNKQVDAYISNNKLDNDAFYNNYYNNIDLWGWATCFLNGCRYAPNYLKAEDKKVFNIGCAKLILYLFTDGAIRIDPKEMIRIMRETADSLNLEDVQELPSSAKKSTLAPLGSSQRPRPVSAKILKEPPTPSQSLPKALRSSAFTKQGKLTKSYKDYLQSLGKTKGLTTIKTRKSSNKTKSVKPASVKRLSPIKEESPIIQTQNRTKGKYNVKSTFKLRSRQMGGGRRRKT